MSLATPNGCAVCGDAEHHHGTQYHPAAGNHRYAPPTDQQRLERMNARRAEAGGPSYRKDQVVVDQGGRRMLIVAVGLEAYLVRRLDWRPDDCEPRESAWGFGGCERATQLEGAA